MKNAPECVSGLFHQTGGSDHSVEPGNEQASHRFGTWFDRMGILVIQRILGHQHIGVRFSLSNRQSGEEREKEGKYAGAPDRFYLSKIMEDYKRHTSFAVNRLRGTRGMQVWQDGFRDDGLRTAAAIRAAVEYVVMNPVKAGLARTADDYPYLAWDAAWLG